MADKILIVDDEPVQRRLLESALVKGGHAVVAAETGEQALELFEEHQGAFAAIVLDLVMPGLGGMEVMERLAERGAGVPVIVQTAQGGIDVVVQAMRNGAFDFVVKPFAPDKLLKTIEAAIRYKGVSKSMESARKKPSGAFTFQDIVTRSEAMQPVLAMARKAADSNIPVLIEGESGTGKELIARAMHGSSDRAGGKLVTVNCGALPENLVESLLFGHEKGAFTGATDKHIGKFEEANGGTLFLDEIGELPLDLQVKLLRAIQEGEIDPVGAKKPVKVDVRLVSATNRNLFEEVSKGRFREDLFYRLSVLPLVLPPLRERREDIEPLVFHFIKKLGREQKRQNISSVDPAVFSALKAYDWPGNIRELENAIFRAIILCESEALTLAEFPQIHAQMPDFELPASASREKAVSGASAPPLMVSQAPAMETPHDTDLIGSAAHAAPAVPAAITGPAAAGNYGMVSLIGSDGECRPIADLEADAIRFAIEIYNGRMSEVARRLGIGRSTLYRKLKELGIEDEVV